MKQLFLWVLNCVHHLNNYKDEVVKVYGIKDLRLRGCHCDSFTAMLLEMEQQKM